MTSKESYKWFKGQINLLRALKSLQKALSESNCFLSQINSSRIHLAARENAGFGGQFQPCRAKTLLVSLAGQRRQI